MWQSSLSPSLPISPWLSVAPEAKADDRVKAAKPDDLVASVVKVDVADDPARVEAEVVDLAKVAPAADDSVVVRGADVGSVSRHLPFRRLWTLTKTASSPRRKLKTLSLPSNRSKRTKTENWIETNSDRLARASVVDVPVVVARELAAPDNEPAWSIDCWPTTKTKTERSRKRKLLNS